MNTILTTRNGTLQIEWYEDAVSSITLWSGHKMTNSNLPDGKIAFSPQDVPNGCILPLTRNEVEEYALMGGKLYMIADDLYALTVFPIWWNVECEMAIEDECPEWPLAEEDIGGESLDLGFRLANVMLDYLNNPDPLGNWDEDEDEEDEGPDFV